MARRKPGPRVDLPKKTVTILLDTHFLIWLVLGSNRLKEFTWLDKYRPWGVSPISLLEAQYLAEVGRIEIENPEFTETLLNDPRFLVDEIPLLSLIRHATPIAWTRDPFDRLLSAHSAARRTPFCTIDQLVLENHSPVVNELSV